MRFLKKLGNALIAVALLKVLLDILYISMRLTDQQVMLVLVGILGILMIISSKIYYRGD